MNRMTDFNYDLSKLILYDVVWLTINYIHSFRNNFRFVDNIIIILLFVM